jgi:hypothetical protein
MNQYTLSFRIDFFPEWPGYDEFRHDDTRDALRTLLKMDIEQKERRRIYHSLGLKLYSNAWADMPLDEDSATGLYNLAAQLEQEHIGFLGSGLFFEKLPSEDEDACEWFEICGCAVGNISNDFNIHDPYPTCRACNYSPLEQFILPHYVSEKFKAVVEKHALTGLDFLWVKDVGRYKAQQWYSAIALHPMGFGFDHPWYDRDKATRNLTSNWRTVPELAHGGMTQFDNRYFKKGWTTGSEVIDKLIALFPDDSSLGFSLITSPRYQRKYLPSTDFGYRWLDEDSRLGSGNVHRARTLCCNRRTKEILLNEGLVRKNDVRGILVFEQLPSGIVDLDQRYPWPPPVYIPEELVKLRQMEKRFLTEFSEKDKPERVSELKRSLKLLRTAKKDRPNDFLPGVSNSRAAAILETISVVLPAAWGDVMKITSGGRFGIGEEVDCVVIPLGELHQSHDEMVAYRNEEDEGYAGGFIYFGTNYCGDHYAFKKDEAARCDDCPVVLISHEDFSTLRQWICIADFLESLLTQY